VKDMDRGIDARIYFGDAREVGFHEFDGGDFAISNQAGLLGGGEA